MTTHSLTQTAALLGVHRNTLSGWLAEGCPAIEKADRDRGIEWKLSLPDIIAWRIDRAVSDAVAAYGGDGSGMSKEEADRRRAVAQAHMVEIDLEERQKAVVRRADAVEDMTAFCVSVKIGGAEAFNKIAVRAAALKEPNEIRLMCEAEWNRAMGIAQDELKRRWTLREAGTDPDAGPFEASPAAG